MYQGTRREGSMAKRLLVQESLAFINKHISCTILEFIEYGHPKERGIRKEPDGKVIMQKMETVFVDRNQWARDLEITLHGELAVGFWSGKKKKLEREF